MDFSLTNKKTNNNSSNLTNQPNAGSFSGYTVAYCRASSEPKIVKIKDGLETLIPEIQKMLQSYNVEMIVVLEANTLKEYIKSYLSLFRGKLGNLFYFRCLAFGLGSINCDGSNLIGIHNNGIYNRLKQVGVLKVSLENSKKNLYLYHITNGPFIVSDKFGLMLKDNVVGQIFNKIKKIAEFLMDHEDSCLKELKEFNYNPNVVVVNHKKSFNSSNVHDHLIIVNNKNQTGLDARNRRDRFRLKLFGIAEDKKNIENSKDEIIEQICHNKRIWTNCSQVQDFYPSKFIAYLVFEQLLNHAFNANQLIFKDNRHQLFIESHEARIAAILVECLKLLYPYAEETATCFNIHLNKDENLNFLFKRFYGRINEYFGIDLANDNHLDLLPKLNGVLSRSLEDEIVQYDEYDRIVSELNKNKKSKTKATIQITPITKESELNSNKEEEKGLVDVNQENQSIANPKPNSNQDTLESEVNSSLEINLKNLDNSIPKIQDEIPKKSKKEKKNALNPERAKQIFSDYKSASDEEEKIREANRMERLKRLYDLPSAEFVEVKIVNHFNEGKGGKNADHFKMLFGLIDNQRTMSNENVLNLTTYITNILTNNNIGCAKDFSNEVKARSHYRHKDGNLLPEFYVNVLRSTCIIFGIFPEDWKPKTVADFDAMTKYEQRCKDIERFEIKNSNKNKS